MIDIDEMLRAAMRWGAADVHLVVPAPSMLRLCNELVPIGHEPLPPAKKQSRICLKASYLRNSDSLFTGSLSSTSLIVSPELAYKLLQRAILY